MSLSQLASRTGPLHSYAVSEPRPRRHGHAHFWERAMSRRGLLRHAAGATMLGLGAGHLAPHASRAAQMEGAMPKPIPGGIDPFGTGEIFHLYLPEAGVEPSSITDFRGFVGMNHMQGEGTVTTGGGGGGTGTPTATGDRLVFDADMRFMRGLYFGEDGQEHHGTFSFI